MASHLAAAPAYVTPAGPSESGRAPVARPGPRLVKLLAGIVAAVMIYALIGFLILPAVVRPQLERELSTALQRTVTIAGLEVNPFALTAKVRDVAVADRVPGPPAFTLAELYANVQAISLFRWAPVVSELRLTRPTVNVVRTGDNTYNFSDVVERALAGPSGPSARFSVSNIEVDGGSVTFDDRPMGKHHEITRIHLGIPFISSLPSQTEIKVQPSFTALVNGRPVEIRGETRPFLDSHETTLHLRIDDLSLPTYVAYSPTPLPVEVRTGVVESALEVRFVAHGSAPPELTVSGTVNLRDLAVVARSGAPLLRVPNLAIAMDKLDVFGRKAEVRSVAIDGVDLAVRRAADGGLNLAALTAPAGPSTSAPAAPPPAPASSPKPFAFHIRDIAIDHGTIRYADEAVRPAFAATASDVALHVVNLSSNANQDATVDLSLGTDSGARGTHHGTLGLAPFHMAGRVEVTGVKLAPLFPYYGSALNLVVDDGLLEGATDFRFEAAPSAGPSFQLANLAAKASAIKLRLPDEKQPLWHVPLLAVRGGAVDIGKHSVHFDAIESRGAEATIRRDADGTFNFARLVRRVPAEPAPATADEPWRLEADALTLDDYAATFEDRTVTPTGRFAMSRTSLRAEHLSNAANTRSRVALRANVGKSGSLEVSGPVTTAPFGANLKVGLKGIALVPFQPYVSRTARVVLTDGRMSARGDAAIATTGKQPMAFHGEIAIDDLAVLDEANETDLLRWKHLALSALDARSAPLAVSIGDIALQAFYARLMLNANGEFNLQHLGRNAEAAPPAAPSPPASSAPRGSPAPPATKVAAADGTTPSGSETGTTWLKLGKATLTEGTVDFTDHFIRPNYSANLTGVNGTISSLAFDNPAEIDLHASVQGSAPVEIAGRINPLARNLLLDIKASATGIEMPPLTPYSGKYVGYGIEKGKLTMKVAYHVQDRTLQAENQIILEQLTFGDAIESPDAIKVPVKLAVALLKDRNGVIQFDMPIAGSLDDPQFSVAGLVFRAIVNLVVKIVTAPFAFLGALGGQAADVSYVDFQPGTFTVDAAGEDKLKALAKGLKERPGIRVDVAGYADRAQDAEALKRSAVRRQVQAQKFNDLVKAGEPPVSVEAVDVAPAEYDALLKRAYRAADVPKPRNAIGMLKDVPREAMEAALLANTKVTDEDLLALGQRRAGAVRAALVDKEQVPSEQVFVVAPRLDAKDSKSAGKPTRAEFTLH